MTRNKVYLGDCMDGMAQMPDNFIDLAIVDPPYGIGDTRQSASRELHAKDDMKWNNDIPSERYFSELIRVSKNRIIWGANYYGKYISDVGRIIHDKVPKSGRNLKEFSDADIASHSFGVNVKIFRYEWRGNVQGCTVNWRNTGVDARIHPTQKPVGLYKGLLANYAKPGNLILDTHVGSGSSIIACIDMGFDYIGYEIDAGYYKAMQDRVYHFTRQTVLL